MNHGELPVGITEFLQEISHALKAEFDPEAVTSVDIGDGFFVSQRLRHGFLRLFVAHRFLASLPYRLLSPAVLFLCAKGRAAKGILGKMENKPKKNRKTL
jgi:hypothetical protein